MLKSRLSSLSAAEVSLHQSKVENEAARPYRSATAQILIRAGVSLATLTNGLDWWFYLPLKEGSGAPFFCINAISEERDDVEAVLLNVLSKGSVASGSAIEYGENLLERRREDRIVNESLPKAWTRTR